MEYMTAKAAADKWSVSDRQVQRLLAEGRIAGAKKHGVSWMIPADAAKPIDPRIARKRPHGESPAYVFLTCADLPKDDPDAALTGMEGALNALAAADIAFRRGDPAPAKAVWRETPRGGLTKLSAASLATAAAISTGDYALYGEIQDALRAEAEDAESERDRALLSLPGALAAVSMAAPEMTPDWLKSGDFSLFPHALRPFLLYLYALHLRNTGAYADMLGVTKATLALTERPATFTWLDIYLGVLYASAAFHLGDEALAKRALLGALALAAPYGMLAPFADHLGALGGLLETVLAEQYPACRKPTADLWSVSFRNWMDFHNTYTQEHITTILTPQEYQTARLIVRGETYAGTARHMHLSVSRVKHILADVYAKLFVQGKQELSQYIL